MNKMNYIVNMCRDEDVYVLGVSETWLTSSVLDSFVSVPGYDIVRSDSPSDRRKHGVAVYIRRGIRYEVVPGTVSNVVTVKLLDFDIYIITLYRAPSYSHEENTQLISFLSNFCGTREVVLQGDFNLPSLRWEREDPMSVYTTPLDRWFFDCFSSLGLMQMIHRPTFFPAGSVIDLVLCSHPERIGSTEVLAPWPHCGHGQVLFKYVFQSVVHQSVGSASAECRIWSRGNYQLIGRCLSQIDWDYEFESLDVNEQYETFLNIIQPLVERFVPPIETSRVNSVPWAKNPPRSLRRERSEAWAAYKSSRSLHGRVHLTTVNAWDAFVSINARFRNFAICAQKNYERTVAAQLQTNPKLFHAYIRHRRVGRPSVGPLRLPDGRLTDAPADMVDCFVTSFATVFSVDEPNAPAPHQTCGEHIGEFAVTPAMVEGVLQSLDCGSSMGGDGMHPRLLKCLASELSLPLSVMFNKSLSTGCLPDRWLSSNVVPIYKKGARFDPLNYRPVSLTSVPCKSMERLVVARLWEYLEANSLLSNQQFGFRRGCSTIDQLILTYNDITSRLDMGEVVDLIFFDYAKAFDMVPHGVLLRKLMELGIDGTILGWIAGFLSNRVMCVKVGGCVSRSVPVTSGVPQGSVLGPVLFLIYINDVVRDLRCGCKIFADDIKMYLSFSSSEAVPSIQQCQEDVDRLVSVSSSWGLHMSPAKCVVLRFARSGCALPFVGLSPYKIGGTYLPFVESHSDLGVTVSRDLKFHSQVRRIAGIAGGMTTNLLSSTLARDEKFLMNIYTSHIRPQMEYASGLWNTGYLGDLRLLERVQRRWTRAVEGMELLEYDERLRRLGLFSFQGRLLRSDLILVWKIFNERCAIEVNDVFALATGRVTRGHPYKIYVPRVDLEMRRRFFSVRVVAKWNALSEETVRATSLETFKRLLQADLGHQLFDYV